MSEDTPRVRTRKPDEGAAEETFAQAEAAVATEAVTGEYIPEVTPATLNGPFSRQGFSIVDAQGRAIAMCGIPGDVARTGPGIAEAILALLNK